MTIAPLRMLAFPLARNWVAELVPVAPVSERLIVWTATREMGSGRGVGFAIENMSMRGPTPAVNWLNT